MSIDAGVAISDECTDYFTKFKLKKLYDFVIYKTNSSMKEIVVDEAPKKGESEIQFKELEGKTEVVREGNEPLEYWNMRRIMLDSKEPRYATIMVLDKLALIVWAPAEAGMQKNMVYTTAKGNLKGRLTGIQKNLQCNDLDELSYAEVTSIVLKK